MLWFVNVGQVPDLVCNFYNSILILTGLYVDRVQRSGNLCSLFCHCLCYECGQTAAFSLFSRKKYRNRVRGKLCPCHTPFPKRKNTVLDFKEICRSVAILKKQHADRSFEQKRVHRNYCLNKCLQRIAPFDTKQWGRHLIIL